jgi:hypothetical protein
MSSADDAGVTHCFTVHAQIFYSLVFFMASSKLAMDDFKKNPVIACMQARLDDTEFRPEDAPDNLVTAFTALVHELHRVPQLCDRIQFLGNLTQMGEAFLTGLRGDQIYENPRIVELQDFSRTCLNWPLTATTTVELLDNNQCAVFLSA